VHQQTQHTLNQNVHNSITQGSPVFYNPFQRLPGILQPLETQALNLSNDKNTISNNSSNHNIRKTSSKALHASSKSLRSSQNLSISQKSLLEAESVYSANSPKHDFSVVNPSKPSFFSFFSNSGNKVLALKGTCSFKNSGKGLKKHSDGISPFGSQSLNKISSSNRQNAMSSNSLKSALSSSIKSSNSNVVLESVKTPPVLQPKNGRILLPSLSTDKSKRGMFGL
jgi:hypothetical protein